VTIFESKSAKFDREVAYFRVKKPKTQVKNDIHAMTISIIEIATQQSDTLTLHPTVQVSDARTNIIECAKKVLHQMAFPFDFQKILQEKKISKYIPFEVLATYLHRIFSEEEVAALLSFLPELIDDSYQTAESIHGTYQIETQCTQQDMTIIFKCCCQNVIPEAYLKIVGSTGGNKKTFPLFPLFPFIPGIVSYSKPMRKGDKDTLPYELAGATALAGTDHVLSIVPVYYRKSSDTLKGTLSLWCTGGDLCDYILQLEEEAPLSLPIVAKSTQITNIMLQVAQGIAAIHTRGFVHLDLKPSNILIHNTANGPRVYICDFEATRLEGSVLKQIVTSYQFAAPEAFAQEKIAHKEQDLWALGLIFQWLLHGTDSIPFLNTSLVRYSTDDYESPNKAPTIIEHWKQLAAQMIEKLDLTNPFDLLICSLMAVHPRERPSADSVVARLQKLQTPFPTERESARCVRQGL
jgi:hypothetical protein